MKGNDMLPNVLTKTRTTAIAALAALSIAAIPAAPAFAWGDKEQNFVAGVATAVIAGTIINDIKHKNRERYYQPQPQYYQPQYPQPQYHQPQYHQPQPRPVYAPPTPSYSSIYSTPAARAFASYSLTERKAIQRSLARYGYYRSGVDGAFGPGTYNAVLAYARDSRLTGNLQSTSGSYGVYDSLIY